MSERFRGNPEGKKSNNSAIFAAIEAGDDKGIMKLFIAGEFDLNQTNDQGITPLMAAIDAKQERIIMQLLRWGANTNAVDNDGQSVLAHAIRAKAQGGRDLAMKLKIFGAK